MRSQPKSGALEETERRALIHALDAARRDVRRGAEIPNHLLVALRRYLAELDEQQLKVIARSLVCREAEAGRSLQRDSIEKLGVESAFDIVAARVGKSARWVEAAYQKPRG